MDTLHDFDEIESLDARRGPELPHPGRNLRSHEARTLEMLESFVEDLSTRIDQDELLPHVRGALLRTMFVLDQLRGTPVAVGHPDPEPRAEDLSVGSLVT